MKIKKLVFASTLMFFIALASNATAQTVHKTLRQKRLEKHEIRNMKRTSRILARNPNGIGRLDNRVNRRAKHIVWKKHRTNWRVSQRSRASNSANY